MLLCLLPGNLYAVILFMENDVSARKMTLRKLRAISASINKSISVANITRDLDF